MTPDQLAKMQEGRRAALAARQAEVDRLASDAAAQFLERHQRAAEDHRRRWQAKLAIWEAK